MNRDLNDQQLSNIYDDLVRENQNVLAEIKREEIGRGMTTVNQASNAPITEQKGDMPIQGQGKLYNLSKKLDNLELLSDGTPKPRKPKNIVFDIKK